MIRAWVAFWAVIAAELEKAAAEMSEAAKKLPEREYWRGYGDGFRDAEANERTKR